MKKMEANEHTYKICMKQTKFKTKLILCQNLCIKYERIMHQKRTHFSFGANIPLLHMLFFLDGVLLYVSMCFSSLFLVNFRCITDSIFVIF